MDNFNRIQTNYEIRFIKNTFHKILGFSSVNIHSNKLTIQILAKYCKIESCSERKLML